MLEFSRARLLGTLDGIDRLSGADVQKALAWRPGAGRAHMAWQFMHCAASHDRYLNGTLLGGQPTDPQLIADFAGGSTPRDDNVPTVADIRKTLDEHYAKLKAYVSALSPADLDRKFMMGRNERTVGESILLMAWHEGHHHGQIVLTWNLYKAAHGIV